LIPAGGRVEYCLRLPAASELAIDRLQFTGPGAGHILGLEEDTGPAEEVAVLDAPTHGAAVALGGDRDRVVRLTLKADFGTVGGGGRAGAILTRPTIRSPVSEMPVSDSPVSGSPAMADGEAPGCGGVREGEAPSGLPNIFLYVVDTLRADHLGLYGYSQPVSPHLDRFAAEATVFDNAVAQSTWTRASMASILTGLWPVKHDTNRRYDVLVREAVTLAELPRAAGYYTVAIAKNENITLLDSIRASMTSGPCGPEVTRIRSTKGSRGG
jgi:hypothetical protein